MAKSLPRSDLTSLYPILTYGGAIPFVMGAACLAVDVRSVPFLGAMADVVGAYGLVITFKPKSRMVAVSGALQ